MKILYFMTDPTTEFVSPLSCPCVTPNSAASHVELLSFYCVVYYRTIPCRTSDKPRKSVSKHPVLDVISEDCVG
jgi:hypothetical protein